MENRLYGRNGSRMKNKKKFIKLATWIIDYRCTVTKIA